MSDLPRTLFTGRRSTAVTWYRCVLPAEFLGQDWIAVVSDLARSHQRIQFFGRFREARHGLPELDHTGTLLL